MQLSRYYTLIEIATSTGIPRTVLYRLVRSGALDAVKVGRRWYIPESSVEQTLRLGKAHPDRPSE